MDFWSNRRCWCRGCHCMPDMFDVETESEKKVKLMNPHATVDPPVCSESYCFWFPFCFSSTETFSLSRMRLWSVSYFPGNFGETEKKMNIYLKKRNTCKKRTKKGSMYVFYCLYSVYSCCPCCLCANVVGEIYIRPLMQLFCGVVQECINMK